jgi:cbb3-type cytochrome oxidase maturation protein
MSVMYILIGCSLILAIGFLAAFIWSVRSGQMEDDYTPSVRILFDDVDLPSDTDHPVDHNQPETQSRNQIKPRI